MRNEKTKIRQKAKICNEPKNKETKENEEKKKWEKRETNVEPCLYKAYCFPCVCTRLNAISCWTFHLQFDIFICSKTSEKVCMRGVTAKVFSGFLVLFFFFLFFLYLSLFMYVLCLAPASCSIYCHEMNVHMRLYCVSSKNVKICWMGYR